MKPLHIINYNGDVRPRRATSAEIAGILDGHSSERLAAVTVGADGDIVATPLTDAEITGLAASRIDDERAAFRDVLDRTLATTRAANGIRGLMLGDSLVLWPTEAPHLEDEVRSWAEDRGLVVHDSKIPPGTKSWIRTAYVSIDPSPYSTNIIRMQWPSVQIDETATAVEVMCHGIAAAFEQPRTNAQPEVEMPF